MKVVSWNCNGALRRKFSDADALNADILVVQECENPAYYREDFDGWEGAYLWTGSNKNKGIGIFPKKGNKVAILPWQGRFRIPGLFDAHRSISWATSDLQIFLPFTVNDTLTVLGVWTKGSDREAFGYIGQLWKYLQIHRKELSNPSTLIVGDLNSNAIWDKQDRWWSHSGVVSELADIGLHSLYHEKSKEPQGSELTATFYMQRKMEKPYHIDYAFVSEDLLPSAEIQIGKPEDWLHISDHMPLTVEI
ncbi:MAG: endonuclease/exonuclease/phosphatase family protein [Pseudomonadales bacterium]|nr:endonuclease/exonuclease/phosphatase family protein [Pseudomonadales bacterium]